MFAGKINNGIDLVAKDLRSTSKMSVFGFIILFFFCTNGWERSTIPLKFASLSGAESGGLSVGYISKALLDVLDLYYY